jgi:hypothetical protein
VRQHDDPELIKAGKAIKALGVPPQHLHVWYSPYLRTQQTMDLVLRGDAAALLYPPPLNTNAIIIMHPRRLRLQLPMATIPRIISYRSVRVYCFESRFGNCFQLAALLISKKELNCGWQEFGDWDNMDDVNMQTENPRRYKALLQVLFIGMTCSALRSTPPFPTPPLPLQAKDAYNKFYFRYPNGESRADVVQRASLFTSKLFK